MSQLGYRSAVYTANGVTQQIASGAIGPGTSTEGIVHSVTLGSNSTGTTLTLRDGGASDAIVFQAGVPANNQMTTFLLDIQLTKGLNVNVANLGGPKVTLTYR